MDEPRVSEPQPGECRNCSLERTCADMRAEATTAIQLAQQRLATTTDRRETIELRRELRAARHRLYLLGPGCPRPKHDPEGTPLPA